MHDNIVSLFGERLSELIHKPSVACKGLIRFSIKEYRKMKEQDYEEPLSISEFEEIVTMKVKQLIIQAGMKDVDLVIESLMEEITRQQAIFTMSS